MLRTPFVVCFAVTKHAQQYNVLLQQSESRWTLIGRETQEVRTNTDEESPDPFTDGKH